MNKSAGEKGVLLLEVVFALTLLAFGITACLQSLGRGLEIAKRSFEYQQAVLAADELFFRLVSGAEEQLLYEGGEGAFESPVIQLDDLRYEIASEQINPVEPFTEEDLLALEKAGLEPPPPDPLQAVEERYRMIKANLRWRGGKESLDFFTVLRLPKPDEQQQSAAHATP